MRVYFYCSDEALNLQEDVVALAEGFRELGIPFHGSCNYWKQSVQPDDYLIKHDREVRPEDCDLVIVSYAYTYFMRPKTFDLVRRPVPEVVSKKGRHFVSVYCDNHDGHQTISWDPEYRSFDLILRSKLNRRAWHPENMKPWVLGFTNRIVRATANGPSFGDRRRRVLVNFGASHPYSHGVRNEAARSFLPELEKLMPFDTTKDDLQAVPSNPYEKLMWEQTGMRFSQSYYDRLKTSQAVACFCGELVPPMPWRDPGQYLVGGNKAKLKRAFFEVLAAMDPRPRRSVQWDSFRSWETWVAGSANINIDLDLYGPVLPIMPENWKHYIGVNLRRPMDAIDRITSDPGLLERVAAQGREWALNNYSPRVMAARLLEMLAP